MSPLRPLVVIAAISALAALAEPIRLLGDAGVLIPAGSSAPNPAILSLDQMAVDIRIDNGDARVSVRQIFASHQGGVLEGEYLFSMPGRATVSDFAVWDGVTRIPGVILERRRAEEIYDSLKQQQIDPGLLQQGERGTEGAPDASRTSAFSARIVPIPGFGTKRLEMEYHELVPVENLRSVFALPLRPDAYNAQSAGQLLISFSLVSAHAIRDFQVGSRTYPLQMREQTPTSVAGSFAGRNVSLSEDFSVEYSLDSGKADTLEVVTYRNPEPGVPNPTEAAPRPRGANPGFFQAAALLAPVARTSGAPAAAGQRSVIVLFDTSLSMQWEKLTRSFQALEAVLRSLRPTDRFNLLLFNADTTLYAPAPVAADTAAVERALDFVRAGRLRGDTDLKRALGVALDQSLLGAGDRYLVLLGDASPTRGTIANAQLAAWYAKRRDAMPSAARPRAYLFGIGDDANVPLLKMLSRGDGVMDTVRATEPIEFKTRAFVSKIGSRPLDKLQMTVDPPAGVDLVYPLDPVSFAGSVASWVGRYTQPGGRATFTVRGARDNRPVEMHATVPLPAESLEHAGLPRTWAKARVDALLDKIARDGEDRSSVDEIIQLARMYKFVTPYTSFLAAPRALLRPRVIKPGDPVLRVATDESITSVVAMFPFGLVKPLRYLQGEHVWQTRFLAPADMSDGTYDVRLIMRDASGHAYRETKSFVIASKPPALRVSADKASARPGETVQLRASASASTRTIVARLYGASSVELRWDPRASASTAALTIPDGLPAGRYVIRVTAEDIAHNIASQELTFDVLP
jgi:Ca-activated chloride channel family protein